MAASTPAFLELAPPHEGNQETADSKRRWFSLKLKLARTMRKIRATRRSGDHRALGGSDCHLGGELLDMAGVFNGQIGGSHGRAGTSP